MKNNLGAILAAIDAPNPKELGVIRNWIPAASMSFVLSKEEVKNEIGLSWQKSYKPKPLFKDAIQNHMGRIRGFESIGLTNVDVKINPDFTKTYELIGKLRLQTAWAFHFDIDKLPRFFVINTFILPHLLRVIPDKMLFVGPEWEEFAHKWLSKHMLPHRYVDATDCGNVTDAIGKPVKSEPIKAPEVVVEPKIEPFDDDVGVIVAPKQEIPAKAPEPAPKKKLFQW